MGTRLNRLTEAVLTSTYNLCFEAKIRKSVYPCKSQFYYIKVGCKGVFATRTCFRDAGKFVLYLVPYLTTPEMMIKIDRLSMERKKIKHR